MKKGFTLIELMVVLLIFAIVAVIVIVAFNPGRQFAQSRDAQRKSDLLQITNAVYQFATEHNGMLPDTDGDDTTSNFPTSPTCIGTHVKQPDDCFDLGKATNKAGKDVIVPSYMSSVPSDPSIGNQENTRYLIYKDASGRIVGIATGEITPVITITR